MPVSRRKSEKVQDREPVLSGDNGSGAIDPEMVARLAHSFWEERGGQGGSPEEDWFRAEQELSGRIAGRIAKAASN